MIIYHITNVDIPMDPAIPSQKGFGSIGPNIGYGRSPGNRDLRSMVSIVTISMGIHEMLILQVRCFWYVPINLKSVMEI